MKKEDLMISDWVKKPSYMDIESLKIGQIELDDFIAEEEYGVLSACEPIPLTSEILEKNGYTCKRSLDKEIISYNWTSPDRRVTLNDQNGSPWFCIICSEGMMEEVMIGINYVHELQHALRLCGIEKEIVL